MASSTHLLRAIGYEGHVQLTRLPDQPLTELVGVLFAEAGRVYAISTDQAGHAKPGRTPSAVARQERFEQACTCVSSHSVSSPLEWGWRWRC